MKYENDQYIIYSNYIGTDIIDGYQKLIDKKNDLVFTFNFKNGVKQGKQKIFKNKKIHQEYYMRKNKLHGVSLYYSDDCILKSKIHYRNGKRQGRAEFYHENGILECICYYKNNLANGRTICFDKFGKKKMKFYSKNNELHGKCYFYENDKIYSTIHYKNNEINGTIVNYYQNTDSIKAIYMYKDGKLNGITRKYFLNGNLEELCSFKNDKIHGVLQNMWADGKLCRILNYKFNKLEGEQILFYPNGNICQKVFYDGDFITYYNNDKSSMKSLYRYKMNQKQGLCCDFFENSNIKSVYYYENNLREKYSLEYSSNKDLLSIQNFLNGNLHGESNFFSYFYNIPYLERKMNYKNGKLIKYYEYKDNLLHGLCLDYENNILRSKNIYKNNILDLEFKKKFIAVKKCKKYDICCVCWENTNSKTLSCSHYICEKCAIQMKNDSCPLCREPMKFNCIL